MIGFKNRFVQRRNHASGVSASSVATSSSAVSFNTLVVPFIWSAFKISRAGKILAVDTDGVTVEML